MWRGGFIFFKFFLFCEDLFSLLVSLLFVFCWDLLSLDISSFDMSKSIIEPFYSVSKETKAVCSPSKLYMSVVTIVVSAVIEDAKNLLEKDLFIEGRAIVCYSYYWVVDCKGFFWFAHLEYFRKGQGCSYRHWIGWNIVGLLLLLWWRKSQGFFFESGRRRWNFTFFFR